jgi:hypothetical protein
LVDDIDPAISILLPGLDDFGFLIHENKSEGFSTTFALLLR